VYFWLLRGNWLGAIMKVLIQCAASKNAKAGKLKTRSGEEVLFVANPEAEFCYSAPKGILYANPDNQIGEETTTWRDFLIRYNEQSENPNRLLRAADLYTPKEHVFRHVYQELADTFGWENVFILSAGWGIIRSTFLIPDYNITFTSQVKETKPWAWRNNKNHKHPWLDFNQLKDVQISSDEPIHFFGGKDYLTLFYHLVENLPGTKIVHYKSSTAHKNGFTYEKYLGDEKSRTWHYRAAKDFIDKHSQTGHH
jgi:hypothetical protein